MLKKVGILLCLVGLGMSCATLRPGSDVTEAEVQTIIRTLESGELASLEQNLATPFLLDTEIILLPRDLLDFWQRMQQAGFSLTNGQIRTQRPAESADYLDFGTSGELEIFFQKYIAASPNPLRLVTLETQKGDYLLLIESGREKTPRLRGLKGPGL